MTVEKTVKDLIGLKHGLDKATKYGSSSYNAREIEDMTRLGHQQYDEIDLQIAEIKKRWWFWHDKFWVMALVLAILVFLLTDAKLLMITSAIAAFYCSCTLQYRQGVYYGYLRGYEAGFEGGVYRACGIEDGDISDIQDRAAEMELDERIVEELRER